jgi:hypothetical protein
LQAAGLEPVGLHLARHTFASYLAAAGLPVKDAQTFAGHADVRTTLSIYTQTLDDAAALAAERAGASLDQSHGQWWDSDPPARAVLSGSQRHTIRSGKRNVALRLAW